MSVPRMSDRPWQRTFARAQLGLEALDVTVGVTETSDGPMSWWVFSDHPEVVGCQQHASKVSSPLAAAVAVVRGVHPHAAACRVRVTSAVADLLATVDDVAAAGVLHKAHQLLSSSDVTLVVDDTAAIPSLSALAHRDNSMWIGEQLDSLFVEEVRLAAAELGGAVAYCDGSVRWSDSRCTQVSAAGWAWVCEGDAVGVGVPISRPSPLRNIQRVERAAIHEAAAHAAPGRPLVVVTDSDDAASMLPHTWQAAGRTVWLVVAAGHTDRFHNHADRHAGWVASQAENSGRPFVADRPQLFASDGSSD